MADMGDAARAMILGRIREANSKAAGSDMSYEAIPREYQSSEATNSAETVRLFVERLREYDAKVWEATDATVRAVIAEALMPVRFYPMMVGSGFPDSWLPDGLEWRREAEADLAAIDSAAGAVVTCEAAIAHTGTIVLKGMRRITLLPDRLLCVVREDQVVGTVPEAFTKLQPLAAEALTFISGPSATADIEMTRIRGVHGPRFLDVVLL